MEFNMSQGNAAYAPAPQMPQAEAQPVRSEPVVVFQRANPQSQPAEEPRADRPAHSDESPKSDAFARVEIEKTISAANKKMEPLYLEFQHKVHEKTQQIMISVVNTSTKEVIREIPPEKSLDALAKMRELTGVLFDKKQ